ncbi:hypothetical protein DWUX_287 [Desulfovibrio diazotrophicus]|nr:hypothetical protein DWUX_287 [Desulfovibrio diazotrophicus]
MLSARNACMLSFQLCRRAAGPVVLKNGTKNKSEIPAPDPRARQAAMAQYGQHEKK